MIQTSNTLKKIVRYFAFLTLVFFSLAIICLIGFLTYATYTAYKPLKIESLIMDKTKLCDTIPAGRLELYTWNIGYCNHGKKMEFIGEKAKSGRPEKQYYEQCRDGIIYTLTTLNKLDFILLQEVDEQSERTYQDNQAERFKATFNDYFSFFALNYKVPCIPIPLKSPLGKVKSGIQILSRFQPIEAKRYSFPTAYNWPKRLFMPNRCFLLTRYKVSNGKQLVVINTHISPYDSGDNMQAKEIDMLKKLIVEEFTKGNYVITGGDWNQNPPTYTTETIKDGNLAKSLTSNIPADFLPTNYTWAFDTKYPTKRETDKPYTKGQTATTIIDFFVLSPNINLLTSNTLTNDFSFSDHQPVGMIVELK